MPHRNRKNEKEAVLLIWQHIEQSKDDVIEIVLTNGRKVIVKTEDLEPKPVLAIVKDESSKRD